MPKNLQGSEICYTFALANEKNECTRLDSLAQLVEHNTFNVGVLGSSPRRITEEKRQAPDKQRQSSLIQQVRGLFSYPVATGK